MSTGRKGRRCPNLHDNDPTSRVRFPHMSRFERDGVACVSLRPPVTVAMQMYFKAQNTAVTLSSAQVWTVPNGPEVVTFVLEGVRPHDAIACDAAVDIGLVTAADGRAIGRSGAGFAGFAAHGASTAAGLSILTVGHIVPGPGMCGHGVYAFEASAVDELTSCRLYFGVDGDASAGASPTAVLTCARIHVSIVNIACLEVVKCARVGARARGRVGSNTGDA